MKRSGHGEKTIHLLSAIGFFIAGFVFLFFPGLLNLQSGLITLFFLLGFKTIGNIIVDAHNVINYFNKL